MKRAASKFINLTNKLIRTRRRYHNLAQHGQQIQRGNMPPGVKPFSIPESEELDNQARKIDCGTWVFEPEATWRDMKKVFVTSSRKRHWQLMRRWRTKELEQTVDNESFMKEWNALRVSRCANPKFRYWRSPDCWKSCPIQWSKQHWPERKRRC